MEIPRDAAKIQRNRVSIFLKVHSSSKFIVSTPFIGQLLTSEQWFLKKGWDLGPWGPLATSGDILGGYSVCVCVCVCVCIATVAKWIEARGRCWESYKAQHSPLPL